MGGASATSAAAPEQRPERLPWYALTQRPGRASIGARQIVGDPRVARARMQSAALARRHAGTRGTLHPTRAAGGVRPRSGAHPERTRSAAGDPA
jgi:hypothetical protein